VTPFLLRPRIGRFYLCLMALIQAAPAFSDNYLEGKMSNASESQDVESYRLSGVYGMPINNLGDTSLEMDFSFTTENLKMEPNYTVKTNENIEIRPEAAGLYLSKRMQLWQNNIFCSDVYVRSGLIYTHKPEDTNGMFGDSRWSPGVTVGMSHNFGDDTSLLMDVTHANGENRFTFGASYRFQMTTSQ